MEPNVLAQTDRPQKSGRIRYSILGLSLIVGLLVIVGLVLVALNLEHSQNYQPQYQPYRDAGAVLQANVLPGSRVQFNAKVAKQAFTQYQDNDKTYPVYQWTAGQQILQARFSSKLKQLPDGNIVINASVQSRVGDELFIFVDNFSAGSSIPEA